MKTKFRQFETSSGKLILAGKNQEQNEELVKKFIRKDNILLHTELPGSPFCVITEKEIVKQDLREAAIFCAAFSQAWKKVKIKKDVIVNYFLGKDVHKEKGMKIGTFSVRKQKKIKIKKEEILEFEGGLR